MKPLYYGNIEYEARQTDIERLFGRYGKVDRVDMKSGNKHYHINVHTNHPSCSALTERFEHHSVVLSLPGRALSPNLFCS